MRNGDPDLVRELCADSMYLERRKEADDCVGNAGADRGYRIAFRGFGSGKPVEAPTDALDNLIRLKLSKPVVGDSQRLQLTWTKEGADTDLVKNLFIEFSGQCTCLLSTLRLQVPAFYRIAVLL